MIIDLTSITLTLPPVCYKSLSFGETRQLQEGFSIVQYL